MYEYIIRKIQNSFLNQLIKKRNNFKRKDTKERICPQIRFFCASEPIFLFCFAKYR